VGKVHWKTQEEIGRERQQKEQEQQKRKVRRQRIKDKAKNANSVKELRELVNDIVIEIGLIDEA